MNDYTTYTMHRSAIESLERAVRRLRQAGDALGLARDAIHPYGTDPEHTAGAAKIKLWDDLGDIMATVALLRGTLAKTSGTHDERRETQQSELDHRRYRDLLADEEGEGRTYVPRGDD